MKRYSGGRVHDEWDHRFVARWLAASAPKPWGALLPELLAKRHLANYIPMRAERTVSLAEARALGRETHQFYDWVRQGSAP